MTAKANSNLIRGGTGDWEVVIGMEVHAQVNSKAKLFSGASTAFGGAPNAQLLVTASIAGAVVEDLPARYPGQMSVRYLRPSTLAELLVARPGSDPEAARTAFIQHGGYPRALAEHRDLGRVSQEFVELLEEGLFKDIGVFALHPVQLDEVITAMCATAGRFIGPRSRLA